MSGIIESRGEIVNWFYEFEPSVKFASGLRKAVRYTVRSELRCPMPYLPGKGELLDEIERSRGKTVARKSAVKSKPLGIATYRTLKSIPKPYRSLAPIIEGVRRELANGLKERTKKKASRHA